MKRSPSIRKLAEVFEDPKEAKRIFQLPREELVKLPTSEQHIKLCYHTPSYWYLRLLALNSIDPGLHGIESLETATCPCRYASYLNTGDSYAPTVIFWQGLYRVQSIGDFIETMERQGVKFK